jgi:AraC-like DNA-binding protein
MLKYYNVEHSPRLVSHTLPVKAFGFDSAKTEIVDRKFEVIGFSFIARGDGMYSKNNQEWPVKGPCVIVQLPGNYYKYGAFTEWDEFFVTYTSNFINQFTKRPWLTLKSPVISFPDGKTFAYCKNEILALCENMYETGNIDRIDRLFEDLLFEIVIHAMTRKAESSDDKIFSLKKWLELHYQEHTRFSELAERFSFSERSLLRHWHQTFGGTPGKYLMEIRIRKACEMLAKTEIPIGDIARETGFEDELYFSRRFHIEMALSPRQYRRKNKV